MTATSAREGSGAMFDGIAHRYDLLNRLISLGIDQSWRRKTVKALSLGPGARVLDLATGTADLALLVARSEPSAKVVGLDPSERMLDVGRKKVAREGLGERVELVVGDAQKLLGNPDEIRDIETNMGERIGPMRIEACRNDQ